MTAVPWPALGFKFQVRNFKFGIGTCRERLGLGLPCTESWFKLLCSKVSKFDKIQWNNNKQLPNYHSNTLQCVFLHVFNLQSWLHLPLHFVLILFRYCLLQYLSETKKWKPRIFAEGHEMRNRYLKVFKSTKYWVWNLKSDLLECIAVVSWTDCFGITISSYNLQISHTEKGYG